MGLVLDAARLDAFVAVARARSFSRAAQRLGKTQPSVSQAIALLERELGQPLFVRDGRVTHLAPAGKRLLVHAERIFAEMEAAHHAVAGMAALRAGELTLGTSDTLACYLLPPVFAAFRQRYPGVELRLENRPSPVTAARVSERALDLGIVTLPLPPEERLDARLRIEPLVARDDVVIAPPGHPLARRRRVELDELASHPLLLLDRTTGTRAAIDAAFAQAGLRPAVAMEMSSVEVLKRLVELGFGISVVSGLAIERELRVGTLVRLRVRGLSLDRTVGLVTPATGMLSPAATAFAELCRSTLKRRGA